MSVRTKKDSFKSMEGSFNVNYVCKYFRYFCNNNSMKNVTALTIAGIL